MEKQILDCNRLKQWFVENQRTMPWRSDVRLPYAVWISEMMLQQTQAAVVIPYFERWMQRFPTVKELAEASLDDVIKMWEGLGYYSRARYLHAGAQYIMEEHCGIFPENEEHLKQIKGLGPYTIGAIRSFAFHHRVPAVDGNVLRVLARYFLITDDIAKPQTVETIRKIAASLLPEKESWIINEALIELGATVCGRKPQCHACPLKSSCKAFIHGKTAEIPFKSTKTKIQPLYRSVAVIHWKDHILVRRGQRGEIMSDLHEFPYVETAEAGIEEEEMAQHILDQFGLKIECMEVLPEVSHSFTRYRVRLRPVQCVCKHKPPQPPASYAWLTKAELQQRAFSAGHRRIWNKIAVVK